MFIPFNTLPGDARVWIYHANRRLSVDEIAIISAALSSFTDRWAVHGTPLPASFEIRFEQFIILAADENSTGVSGCSIDDSVRTIKDLGQKLGIELFDRTLVGFKEGDEIVSIPMAALQQTHRDGLWNSNTLVANSLLGTKGELEADFFVPAGLTWLKRYLPHEKVPR